jgi:hypothetical protein
MHELPDDFGSVQPPEGDATEQVRTALGSYEPLAQGGDRTDSGELLGIPYTDDGTPLGIPYMPAFNGFVPDGPEGGYLFTNWEFYPGRMSRLRLERSGEQGSWSVVERRNIDFRDIGGTWFNCFGTVTPWNTPLSSEEFEPDAKAWADTGWFDWTQQEALPQGAQDELGDVLDSVKAGFTETVMEQYLGKAPNAYQYGYIIEVLEPTTEDPTPVKHYCMGRFSHENAVVMPDEQTVYLSDDTTGSVLFKFVADQPGDLSAGTLYAAKASQDAGRSSTEVGFGIDWVELASGSDEQIRAWIEEYEGQSDREQYITDEEIQAWANGTADDDRVAFLESRKAAEAKGATAEFRKMEGINVRPNAQPGDYVYVSMSEINETMADGDGDVQLEGNDYGVVYRMQLDENYDISRMEPAVAGGPDANVCGGCPYDADPNSKHTVCQDCEYNPTSEDEEESEDSGIDGTRSLFPTFWPDSGSESDLDTDTVIANPDNLVVMPDGRVLIGEDTDFHDVCYIWVFDPADD